MRALLSRRFLLPLIMFAGVLALALATHRGAALVRCDTRLKSQVEYTRPPGRSEPVQCAELEVSQPAVTNIALQPSATYVESPGESQISSVDPLLALRLSIAAGLSLSSSTVQAPLPLNPKN